MDILDFVKTLDKLREMDSQDQQLNLSDERTDKVNLNDFRRPVFASNMTQGGRIGNNNDSDPVMDLLGTYFSNNKNGSF